MAASTAPDVKFDRQHFARFLCCTLAWETVIPQSQSDQVVARIVLPCPCKILKIDYDIQVGGSTHTLANIEGKVDGTAITSAYTAANTTKAAMSPTDATANYVTGQEFTLELDTDANSTVSFVGVTLTILPTGESY